MATVPASGPGAPVRPATVTYASWLLYLVGALQLISVPIALLTLGPTRKAVDDAIANDPNAQSAASAIQTITTVAVVIGVVIALLFGVCWIILGMLNARGKQPARIVTWVLGGLFLCCLGFGLVGNAFGNAFSRGTTTAADQAEIQRQITAALPGWYRPVTVTISVIEILAILLAIILLALPVSHPWFRRRVQVWEPPPMPGSSYPYPPAG
jgi:hypothetical protein